VVLEGVEWVVDLECKRVVLWNCVEMDRFVTACGFSDEVRGLDQKRTRCLGWYDDCARTEGSWDGHDRKVAFASLYRYLIPDVTISQLFTIHNSITKQA